MCGGVVNNQIGKGLLLSLNEKKIKFGEYLARETTTLLLETLPNIYRF